MLVSFISPTFDPFKELIPIPITLTSISVWNRAINPTIVPENIIKYTIEKIPSPIVIDSVVGTRLGYFFLEVKKFIFSFFF